MGSLLRMLNGVLVLVLKKTWEELQIRIHVAFPCREDPEGFFTGGGPQRPQETQSKHIPSQLT